MRKEIEDFSGYYTEILHTGSRVICDPPPKDTDDDYLMLTWEGALDALVEKLNKDKYELGGSMNMGGENYERRGLEIQDWSKGFEGIDYNKVFRSYKKSFPKNDEEQSDGGDVNIIVTLDPHYFKLFTRATGLAKKLNLLKKEDRVALFETIVRDVDWPVEDEKKKSFAEKYHLGNWQPLVPGIAPIRPVEINFAEIAAEVVAAAAEWRRAVLNRQVNPPVIAQQN